MNWIIVTRAERYVDDIGDCLLELGLKCKPGLYRIRVKQLFETDEQGLRHFRLRGRPADVKSRTREMLLEKASVDKL